LHVKSRRKRSGRDDARFAKSSAFEFFELLIHAVIGSHDNISMVLYLVSYLIVACHQSRVMSNQCMLLAMVNGRSCLLLVRPSLAIKLLGFTDVHNLFSFFFFLIAGMAMRYCIALGLNNASSDDILQTEILSMPAISPTKNFVEAETRRNVFWLAYSLERFHMGPWPAGLDDLDINRK